MDLLTKYGVSLTADPNDPISQRIQRQVIAELEKKELEQAKAKVEHDKYLRRAREMRDHVAESGHRIATSGLTKDQLSDAALKGVSEYLLPGVSDDQLRQLFGPTSDSKLATQLGMKNPLLYRTLRELARERRIF